MNKIAISNSKDYGLTTGTIATATAVTALKSILNFKNMEIVTVETPFDNIDVKVHSHEKISENEGIATVIKYPYDDPDVTINLKISAYVKLFNKKDYNGDDKKENVLIFGGKGIGTVTKPGLQIPVGNPAINPIPKKMIKENILKYISNDKIAEVEISVLDGEKIAKKTMNPRLGIVNGISILGTTGIARSFSSKAYKKSLLCQLDIAIAEKYDKLIFVPGNIGEKIAIEKLNVKKDQIIQMGNYVGFMLKEAKKRKINKLTLFGHPGKLVKIAGGIFNTKNSVADGRREILVTHASLCGANLEITRKIFNSKTTEEMIAILKTYGIDKQVLNSITSSIKKQCLERFDLDVDVYLVDMKENPLNRNFN